MTTVSPNFISKDVPILTATLDTKLNFISYSEQWLLNFIADKNDITGKNIFEVIKDVPVQFSNAIKLCLEGHIGINDRNQFLLRDGKTKWLSWRIFPFINNQGIQEGILIFLEELSDEIKELELLRKAESVARIGGWEVDLLKKHRLLDKDHQRDS